MFFSIKVIFHTGRSGLTGPTLITFQIVISCNRLPGFVLLIVNHLLMKVFPLVFVMIVVT